MEIWIVTIFLHRVAKRFAVLLYPGKVDSEALLFQSTKRALKFIKREYAY